MKNTKYNNSLMNGLAQLEENSPCERMEINPAQNERICRMALEKVKKEMSAENDKQIRFSEQTTGKSKIHHIRHAVRIGLVAAAVVCLLAIPAYAAGTLLLPMLTEKIGFFQNAPSQEQVDNTLYAPRGEHEGQPLIEAFNTAVGMSVTDQGITVTLDNVSMDVSGLDLFLTVEGKEAIDKIIAENDYMPLYYTVRSVMYFGDSSLNGHKLILSPDSNDWYQQKDGSIKVIVHSMLPTLPEGDELILNVKADYVLEREGNWSITAALDGASVRTGAKLGKPDVYSQPAEPAQGEFPEINRDLNLVYAAFGPRGGVMISECFNHDICDENDVPLYSWNDGSTLSEFMITDNTGKTLFAGRANHYTEPETDRSYCACDLTMPDPEATSLTLTPMKVVQEKNDGFKTYTTDQLKAGVKISNGPESGFYIQNFRQEGSSFVWEQVPYGYMPQRSELIPEDENIVTMTEENRFGLIDAVRDPYTGIFNCRIDYYVADPDEVAKIENWSVASQYYQPMHENDFTIPLSALENSN